MYMQSIRRMHSILRATHTVNYQYHCTQLANHRLIKLLVVNCFLNAFKLALSLM